MYAALSRSACALPLNLTWGFESTSRFLNWMIPAGSRIILCMAGCSETPEIIR
jgi:hypothetical protein